MIRTIPVVAESPRYTPPLLYLPGLWCRAAAFGGIPGALAHRGWEGAMLEFAASERGGVEARAEAVAAHVRGLPSPPVLVGHDAGGIVALAVAQRVPLVALILLAPLAAGAWSLRLLVRRLDAFLALLRGRPVPPPHLTLLARVLGALPAGGIPALVPEPADLVLDVLRRRRSLVPPPPPVLVVAGARDVQLGPEAAAAMAARLGAEHRSVADAGHWLACEPSWYATAATIHRWLIRRLGEDVLELHAEAMAERGDDPD
ncbi:MAG: alpha/beta fold hydrolase [bacterium]|nr:alpha/beta fold hydrolase [bacterium]